jgi:hypothetical protein
MTARSDGQRTQIQLEVRIRNPLCLPPKPMGSEGRSFSPRSEQPISTYRYTHIQYNLDSRAWSSHTRIESLGQKLHDLVQVTLLFTVYS